MKEGRKGEKEKKGEKRTKERKRRERERKKRKTSLQKSSRAPSHHMLISVNAQEWNGGKLLSGVYKLNTVYPSWVLAGLLLWCQSNSCSSCTCILPPSTGTCCDQGSENPQEMQFSFNYISLVLAASHTTEYWWGCGLYSQLEPVWGLLLTRGGEKLGRIHISADSCLGEIIKTDTFFVTWW